MAFKELGRILGHARVLSLTITGVQLSSSRVQISVAQWESRVLPSLLAGIVPYGLQKVQFCIDYDEKTIRESARTHFLLSDAKQRIDAAANAVARSDVMQHAIIAMRLLQKVVHERPPPPLASIKEE